MITSSVHVPSADDIRARRERMGMASPRFAIVYTRAAVTPDSVSRVKSLAAETKQAADDLSEATLAIRKAVVEHSRALAEMEEIERRVEGARSVLHIAKATAAITGVSLIDLKSHRKSQRAVRARQIAMFLARQSTARSLGQVGAVFGGRDHTTVVHAVQRVAPIWEALPIKPETLAEQIESLWCADWKAAP